MRWGWYITAMNERNGGWARERCGSAQSAAERSKCGAHDYALLQKGYRESKLARPYMRGWAPGDLSHAD